MTKVYIVPIIGHSRTGKDTVANAMATSLIEAGIEVTVDSFAQPLRTAVSVLTDSMTLGKEPKGIYRDLMYGISQVTKACLGKDVFTKRLIEDFKYVLRAREAKAHVLIVSDVRRWRERTALRELAMKLEGDYLEVHMDCPEIDADLATKWWHTLYDPRNEFVKEVTEIKSLNSSFTNNVSIYSVIGNVEGVISQAKLVAMQIADELEDLDALVDYVEVGETDIEPEDPIPVPEPKKSFSELVQEVLAAQEAREAADAARLTEMQATEELSPDPEEPVPSKPTVKKLSF